MLGPDATAFAFDILAPSPAQDGISTGVIPTSHLMVGTDATPCSDMLGRLDNFLETPGSLEINGVEDSTSFEDGIFGSAEEDRYVIPDAVTPITLHATSSITGGFAVLLVFPDGGPEALNAEQLSADDYEVMRVSNTDRIVWFRNGLAQGANIVLQPG
jgi:hypothetical protein